MAKEKWCFDTYGEGTLGVFVLIGSLIRNLK
jgi:hypothetical protein